MTFSHEDRLPSGTEAHEMRALRMNIERLLKEIALKERIWECRRRVELLEVELKR